MNKTTISDLVEAQPDEVDLEQLIEQLCLLRRLEFADEDAAARQPLDHHQSEQRLERVTAAVGRN
jgi:hypothetical protein